MRVRARRTVEFVFNTPFHHRVHHGSDEICLDRNYGDILIVWDRMFGTFQPELFRPKYDPTYRVGTASSARNASTVSASSSWTTAQLPQQSWQPPNLAPRDHPFRPQISGGRPGRSTLTLAGWLSICRSVSVTALIRWMLPALRLPRSSGS